MKFVYAPSNDTDPPASPYRTLDNISGVNDVGGAAAQSQWVAGPTPTFVSGTSFTLVGDQTATFHAGRRLQSTNTAGTIYSTILTSVFTSLTTVTVANDSGALDSGLSAVNYGLISAVNTSDPNIFGKGIATIGYNIKAVCSTASQVQVSADYIQLNDSSGNTVTLSSIAFTADITSTGLNGLDTGSESSNTWYYCYLISNAQSSSGTLLSIQSSAPTLPAGYTYKALVTAIYNLGSNFNFPQRTAGRRVFPTLDTASTVTEANSTWSGFSIATLIPPIATKIGLQGFLTNETSTSYAEFRFSGESTEVVSMHFFRPVCGPAVASSASGFNNATCTGEIPYVGASIFGKKAVGTTCQCALAISYYDLPGGGQ